MSILFNGNEIDKNSNKIRMIIINNILNLKVSSFFCSWLLKLLKNKDIFFFSKYSFEKKKHIEGININKKYLKY